jgi:hypothetical protein
VEVGRIAVADRATGGCPCAGTPASRIAMFRDTSVCPFTSSDSALRDTRRTFGRSLQRQAERLEVGLAENLTGMRRVMHLHGPALARSSHSGFSHHAYA